MAGSNMERLNSRTRRCAATLTIFGFALPVALAQHPQPATISSAGAAHSLSEADAARALPVHFRGVVTFYDPSKDELGASVASLFVMDKTGGVWVGIPARPLLPLREGTVVEVDGVTAHGNFAADVEAHVKVLGQPKSPLKAPLVSVAELATGAYDCLFVQVEGVVHSVSRAGHLVSLQVATRDGPIRAMTASEAGVDYNHLIDATIRLRGVAAVDYNKQQQMTGVHLFFQDMKDLTVRLAPRGDPFALPVRTLDSLARFDPKATADGSIHVRGRLSLQWPGQLVCVQDGTGGLCVSSTERHLFPRGNLLDVVGYPVLAAAIPALADATARSSPMKAAPLALQPVKASGALHGDFPGRLIALEGVLAGVSTDERQWLLTIRSDGIVFTALLPRGAGTAHAGDWREGSVVRVTGVCVTQVETQIAQDWEGMQRLSSFRILMRSPDDVIVLRKPSWWTPEHTFSTLGLGFVAMAAIFWWVVSLRRQVEERTWELQESERRFRHLAHHDSLTGVPNRAWFQERAERALALSGRSGECVGLLLLDLDHFKPVNDTLGHDAGDAMLCALAQRVAGAIRKVDTLARLGGDEFAVVLVDLADSEDAEQVARKILEAVCKPVEIKGRAVGMSASIGVAVFPEDGESVTELLRSADLAMYQSKKHLRGGVRRYRREATLREIEDAEAEASTAVMGFG